jgi:predicted small secreted protein
MNSLLRRLVGLLLAAALFSLVTTGCQTSKGFGKDVEKLGDKIQEKASK